MSKVHEEVHGEEGKKKSRGAFHAVGCPHVAIFLVVQKIRVKILQLCCKSSVIGHRKLRLMLEDSYDRSVAAAVDVGRISP
jgi:hypothetical protein